MAELFKGYSTKLCQAFCSFSKDSVWQTAVPQGRPESVRAQALGNPPRSIPSILGSIEILYDDCGSTRQAEPLLTLQAAAIDCPRWEVYELHLTSDMLGSQPGRSYESGKVTCFQGAHSLSECSVTFWGLSFPCTTSMKSSSDTVKVTSTLPLKGPWCRAPLPFFRSMAGWKVEDKINHLQRKLHCSPYF